MFSSRTKRAALRNLLIVADTYAFKGTMHWDEHDDMDRQYLRAINRMEKILDLPLTKKLEP